MRTLVIAAVMAIGVGFAGAPASAAMPASGTVIGHAAKSGAVVEQARWWRRHHHRRHCWWHRGHLHCGW
jgi:hypothetical protein